LDRVVERGWLVSAVVAELGASPVTVRRLLDRYGVRRSRRTPGEQAASAHGRRVQAEGWQARRAAQLAELGFGDLGSYLRVRYAGQGWSVRRMRDELGVGKAWLVRGDAPAGDRAVIRDRSALAGSNRGQGTDQILATRRSANSYCSAGEGTGLPNARSEAHDLPAHLQHRHIGVEVDPSRHSTSNVTCPSRTWPMVDLSAALAAAIAVRALPPAVTGHLPACLHRERQALPSTLGDAVRLSPMRLIFRNRSQVTVVLDLRLALSPSRVLAADLQRLACTVGVLISHADAVSGEMLRDPGQACEALMTRVLQLDLRDSPAQVVLALLLGLDSADLGEASEGLAVLAALHTGDADAY
jgi:hypothetical protein